MYQRVTPKSTRTFQAIALPMESDTFNSVQQAKASGYSFYPLAVLARVGLLGVLLFNAFAFWFS